MSIIQQFILRFRDAFGQPRDLEIEKTHKGQYSLGIHQTRVIDPITKHAQAAEVGEYTDLHDITLTKDFLLSGFFVTGHTDAKFFMIIIKNNATQNKNISFSYVISNMTPQHMVTLPAPILLQENDRIWVFVQNRGQVPARMECSILELKDFSDES